MPVGAVTNTCSKRGSTARASSPQASGSTGITRQPASVRPWWAQASASTARARAALASSGARKMLPAAYWLAPSSMPASFATRRRNRSGFFISRPQPSPVLPSAAMAPRWVIRSRPLMARLTRSWLATSSICAIRPKPQLSRSNSGRYRPTAWSCDWVIANPPRNFGAAKPSPQGRGSWMLGDFPVGPGLGRRGLREKRRIRCGATFDYRRASPDVNLNRFARDKATPLLALRDIRNS